MYVCLCEQKVHAAACSSRGVCFGVCFVGMLRNTSGPEAETNELTRSLQLCPRSREAGLAGITEDLKAERGSFSRMSFRYASGMVRA